LKFGLRLPRTGPFATAAAMIKVAQKAEELGYDAVTVNDALSWSFDRRYHFSAGTKEAMDRTERGTYAYEAVTTLSFIAGMTHRIRLIPAAFVLPWRGPIMLAKQFATLQELSNDRFILGICIGNIEEDFKNSNVDFKARGAITDEYLRAIKELFSNKTVVDFHGKYAQFRGEFYPKPKKAPIWIAGGFREAGLRRVAQFGDGWLPIGTAAQLRLGLRKVKELQRTYGMEEKELEVGPQVFICLAETDEKAWEIGGETVKKFGGLPEITRLKPHETGFAQMNLIGSVTEVSKRISEYKEAGANFVELKFISNTLDEMLGQISLFASQIMPSFSHDY